MTYGIMEILLVLFSCIHLHPNWITNIISFLLLYDQHIATFISSGYGDLHTMMVLRVACYRTVWILHYSLVARYQNNIILSLLYSWYICRIVELSLILDALSNY